MSKTHQHFRIIAILFTLFILSLLSVSRLYAQTDNIQFPINDLGGCNSKSECKQFCDQDANHEKCFTFAQSHGLMSKDEVEKARKVVGGTGPGGCQGEACRTYCEDVAHHDECLSFAEKNGLISRDEATRIKKFRAVAEEGGPGGCKGEECRSYCEDSSHREECFTFAKEKGIVSDEEVLRFEQGKKIMQKIEQSGGPGGCKNEGECKNFCSDPNNVEGCVTFGAEATGRSQEDIKGELKNFQQMKAEFEKRMPNNSNFNSGEFQDRPDRPDMRNISPEEKAGMRQNVSPEEKARMMQGYRQDSPGTEGPSTDNKRMMPPTRERQVPPQDYKMNPEQESQYKTYMQNSPSQNVVPSDAGSMMVPPPNSSMPSSGSYQQPSDSYQQPSSGSYQTPSSDSYRPGGGETSAPSTYR